METISHIDIDVLLHAHPYVATILERLSSHGHNVVLIGGVVRDAVGVSLGRPVTYPPADVDVATSAMPDEVRALFSDRPIVRVGEEFGVLVIVAPDGIQYEVATFRVEADYDGRWPNRVSLVRTLEGDVLRRDLTINGMAADANGRIIDLVGGIQDLKEGRVRAIGDPVIRFEEDHLRMLRAVRFACQVRGTLDSQTAEAIAALAPRIERISKERIRDELLRLLSLGNSADGLEQLDELGLLSVVLPEVTAGKGVPQPEEYHPEGDVYVHTIEAVRNADGFVVDPLVKLAVVLHDIGKPDALERNDGVNMGGHCVIGARMTKEVCRRLRLSRHETARVTRLVRDHMRIADFPKMGRGKQVRFLSAGADAGSDRPEKRYAPFFDLLQLLVADCEASAHHSSGWGPILRETIRVIEHIDRAGDLNRARTIFDGHTLIEMGVVPGPRFGELLRRVHDRILAGDLSTRDEAMAWVQTELEDDAGPSASQDRTPDLSDSPSSP